MTQVSVSILSADFSQMGTEVSELERAGADMIHIDVMDGHFVPNLTMGPVVVAGIRPKTKLPLDVHLMITNPADFIAPFAEAGADFITVHLEATNDVPTLISKIKKEGKGVGLSIKPSTPAAALIPYLPDIDRVLVMTVEPGFSGQPFQPQVIKKIAEIKDLIGRKKIEISVDGGVNPTTAPACVLAGANILVAASYIFNNKPYAQAIKNLKDIT